MATCQDCARAVLEVFRAKQLFQGAASLRQEERPWFAARVMAAIAAREKELAERVTAWTEFPRFASRLTWVAAVVLLASTTWFYESVLRAPRSEEHTSELQSRLHLVCRLLLEKKKNITTSAITHEIVS